MRREVAAPLALLIVSCGPAAASRPPTPRSPGEPGLTPPGLTGPPADEPSALQAAMRSHFEEIRQVEMALVFGDLETARFHARALTTVAERSTVEQRSLARVRGVAADIAAAPTTASALPLVAALAGECRGCHDDARAFISLPRVAEPAEDGSAESRMARHQWAADRIWEGLVAPNESRWRDGLEVLAEEPLPPDGLTDDRAAQAEVDRLGRELAGLAAAAMGARPGAERDHAFGQMLVRCAACHALVRR